MTLNYLTKKSVGVALIVSTLTVLPYSTNACQRTGMYPMMGGMGNMGGMSGNMPMSGNFPHFYPRYGMPWTESMSMATMYVPSGMYPMYGDPRYMAQSPQSGMPWSGSMQPITGMFGMVPMSGGMVVMPPMTGGVPQPFPMYGMPWNLYSQQVPMYVPSGMYPMQGYGNMLSTYPMYGMPWFEGR